MRQPNETRSFSCATHSLRAPDGFCRAPLPGMRNATAIIHIAPVAGARFAQYTVEFQEDGLMNLATTQCLVYVLEGKVEIDSFSLEVDDYAYLPPGRCGIVSAKRAARVTVIEKRCQRSIGAPVLEFFIGRERLVEPQPLMGDASIQVRMLVPDNGSVDFGLNTITCEPGASLPSVEMHAAEFSQLVLSGGGVFRLGEDWHRVKAGDIIWVAAHCPQWFGALGKTPAKFLIYRN